MASCAAIGTRRSSGMDESCERRIANPPQVNNLPHKMGTMWGRRAILPAAVLYLVPGNAG
jgi:hypothetical protein